MRQIEPNGTAQPYGSFHELYYLDDELVAMAVLDILPACVSSVCACSRGPPALTS